VAVESAADEEVRSVEILGLFVNRYAFGRAV
jgi:hypothetical protein